MTQDIQPGEIGWVDLTVDNATQVRDFYRAVVGWEYRDVQMEGGYADYAMTNLEGRDVTGICHARGINKGVPAQWLVYFTVLDLQFAVDETVARGGAVLRGPTDMEVGRFAVIRDPAGAVCALFQAPSGTPEKTP